MAYEGMIAETISINGNKGEPISAYVARPPISTGAPSASSMRCRRRNSNRPNLRSPTPDMPATRYVRGS